MVIIAKKAFTGVVKIGAISLIFVSIALVLGSLFYTIYKSPVLAQDTPEEHSSGSNVITPGFQKCEIMQNYTLTVIQTGGPDPIFNVKFYNGTLGGPFSDQTDFSCGGAPEEWVLKNSGTYFCIGGDCYCEYETAQNPNNTFTIGPGEHLNFTFNITITNESNHTFTTTTTDTKFPTGGSTFSSLPFILVDCTPPITTKHFDGPNKTNESGVEWIDGVTQIVLESIDPLPHPSGVNATYWRTTLLQIPDQNCTAVCEFIGSGNWSVYNGSFNKSEESCHLLEFWSHDNVTNQEDVNKNCFFVDKTPPVLIKEVSSPKSGDCPPGQVDDCFITNETTISLNCEDQEPHPSGMEMIWYRYNFTEDGQIWSPWLNLGNCDDTGQNGWCKVNNPHFEFEFPESSLHGLQVYCVDGVNKTSDIDTEFFKVDNESPEITKMMLGEENLDWIGDCPPQNESDKCYVADNGVGGVSVWVEDPNQVHSSNEVSCEFQVWLDGQIIDSDIFSNHVNITFNEDSTHTLLISCQDALGNDIHDQEIFLVDSLPPVTTKTYGYPLFTCYDWCVEECYGEDEQNPGVECIVKCLVSECGGQDIGGHWYPVWINSSTWITLNATDEKVGVNTTWWRNTIVPDQYCQEADWCLPCEATQANCSNFTIYNGPFHKPNESCHLIEYYSVDWLNNTERIRWQCAYVDNTPPVGIKEVGEHSIFVNQTVACPDNSNGNGNGQEPDFVINAVGDVVHRLNLDAIISSPPVHCSIGVAFDGSSLYVDACGDPNIYKIHPITASVQDTITPSLPSSAPNAMAYDATRNGIWFGVQNCDDTGMPIYFYNFTDNSTTLMFHVPSGLINPATGETFVGLCFLDGLAFNANGPGEADDELWFSDDINKNLGKFRPNGTLVTGYDATTVDDSLSSLSGLAIGGDNLYMANDGGGDVFRANKDTLALVDQFVSEDERQEDMECDPITFAPTEVMWVRTTPQSGTFPNNLTAYEIEPGTCGAGGIKPHCGNGTLEEDLGEQCDDGNNLNDDGCSATCEIEPAECHVDWLVNQNTSVHLTCRDPDPHPVDHESVCYKVSFEDNGLGDLTSEYCEGDLTNGWCCVESNEVWLNFKEDSLHNLEYYCTDALGNANEPDLEFFAVDTVPPEINKTNITGPHSGDCPPGEGQSCFIGGNTIIHVEAVDPEPHAAGNVTCNWSYQVIDGQGSGGQNDVTPPFDIQFPEESTHELWISCSDALWNTVEDHEIFVVDETNPETIKMYGEPFFNLTNENGTYDWISSSTPINLWSNDTEPHPSGVDTISWRTTLLQIPDQNCTAVCEFIGSGNWNSSNSEHATFYINEESCHLIEFFANDTLGNTEETHRQCVFVDSTPPAPNKTVGKPSEIWNGSDAIFYNISDKCWNGSEDELECWKVTTMTPITLDCSDQGPHPVDNENVCFKIDFDGDDITQQYCDDFGGSYNETGNGYCCLLEEQAPVEILFGEESEHNLQFYCIDQLNNTGPVDEEKFKVEGSKFSIWLNKKWNLISVPFVLQENSMKIVFNDTNNVTSVWTYDAVLDRWYVFTPDGNDLNDDLLEMVPGMGYWVLATDDTMLVIGGSLFSPAVTPPSKKIVAGWNLIGYYGNLDDVPDGNPLFEYHGPIGAGADAICALGTLVDTTFGNPKWASLWTYWEPDNPDQWKPLGFFDNMDPGAGYWLEIDVNESYSVSTTCPIII